VLPTDVRYCAPRVVAYVEQDAQTALADALNLWMKLETSLSPDQQSISKASANTTGDGYADGPLSPATSCFASNKQARQSWSHHGRDHISSTKPSQEEHIGNATHDRGG
jgi:hypothetical protein